ncbi:MAG: 30S ribosome-binding factor RbfA [Nevskia sp.]|nr:30S ribosome-binding factor RbfA [Nevskia sp.]
MPKEFSRTLRLNAQLQQELASLIRDELTDPRVVQVSVTRVDVAPDLRNANVAVSSLGADAELAAAVKALNGAAARLRRGLGRRLRLRYVPLLRFTADTGLREGDRIGALIRQAAARDRAAHQPDGSEPADEG